MTAGVSQRHEKPLVYIAGPYRSPDPPTNTSHAIRVGRQLRDEMKVVTVVPHFSLLEDMLVPADPQYWLDITMDLLRCCDAVFRLPGHSTGSDAEEAEAILLGIPVFHSRPKLAEWVCNWKGRYDLCHATRGAAWDSEYARGVLPAGGTGDNPSRGASVGLCLTSPAGTVATNDSPGGDGENNGGSQ